MRDIFSEHFERAIVDDEGQHHRLVSFFTRTAPELVDRVELYDGEDPLFEAYGVDSAINGMLERRVDLPSGGYLIIDYAEALTVIDVNTGSFTGKGKSARLEDTITKTNLEAAEEVVRQLRLRDIGGIIVIDFIDMARSRNRDAVLKVLRKALDEDRTKTFVVEISPLGLVEMTRQNVTDGVREIMTKPCPVCSGEGVVKSEETIAIEFGRHLRHMVIEAGESGPEAYLLRINPKVTAWFIADGARELHAIEQETGRWFHFEGSDGLPLDYFAVTMEGTREEIEAHAVPFRAGEEVHVNLVEPHMYNDDDAVAKVDGYLIDVVNGIAFVGEKKLVRIEEAGRTIARAVLVGADAEAAEEAAKERAAAREKALQQARRSAAAKKGAAKRREREDATKTLADETPVEAGTAPAAVEDDRARRASARAAAAAPRTRRPQARRRRGHRAGRGGGAEAGRPPFAQAGRGRGASEAPEAVVDRGRGRAGAQGPDPPPSRGRRRRGRGGRRRADRGGGAEAGRAQGPRAQAPADEPTAEEAVEARDAVAEEGGGAGAQAPRAAPQGRRGAGGRRAEQTLRRATTRRPRTTTRYPLALGAAAVEVDGAVRARRLRLTPRSPTEESSDYVLRSHQDRRQAVLRHRGPDPPDRASARRRRRHRGAPAAAAGRQRRSRVRGRRARVRDREGGDRRAPARAEAARLQVQAQARLQAPHGPPSGTDADQDHVDQGLGRELMAHKKGLGSSRNGRDSNAKRLGVKVFAGETVTGGEIIVRQRGTKFKPGNGVGIGRDDTIYARAAGTVDFTEGRRGRVISVLRPPPNSFRRAPARRSPQPPSAADTSAACPRSSSASPAVSVIRGVGPETLIAASGRPVASRTGVATHATPSSCSSSSVA